MLRLLASYGDLGVLTGNIVDHFTDPPERDARNRLCNSSLSRLLIAGEAERLPKERGTRYHGTPSWRWRITSTGRHALAHPRKTKRQQLAEARKVKAEGKAFLLEQLSRQEVGKGERGEVALIMTDGGFTMQEAGDFLGITRERVRQLIQGELIETGAWDRLPEWGAVLAQFREKGVGPESSEYDIMCGVALLEMTGCPRWAMRAYFRLAHYKLERIRSGIVELWLPLSIPPTASPLLLPFPLPPGITSWKRPRHCSAMPRSTRATPGSTT